MKKKYRSTELLLIRIFKYSFHWSTDNRMKKKHFSCVHFCFVFYWLDVSRQNRRQQHVWVKLQMSHVVSSPALTQLLRHSFHFFFRDTHTPRQSPKRCLRNGFFHGKILNRLISHWNNDGNWLNLSLIWAPKFQCMLLQKLSSFRT